MRRLLVALPVAVVVGVVFVLATASIAAVPWDAQSALTVALGAVFLSQSLLVTAWLTARTSPGGAR